METTTALFKGSGHFAIIRAPGSLKTGLYVATFLWLLVIA